MSDRRHILNLSPGFAAQFVPDGDGYLFRKAWKGAAIPVDAAERDDFVSAFSRALLLQLFGLVAGLAAVVILPIEFAFARGPLTVVWVVVGATALTVVLVLGFCAAWEAPSRALAGRAAVLPALSKAEARRAGWANLSWAQIGFYLFWALFLASRGLNRTSTIAPWIWFSMAAILLLGSAVIAFQKMRVKVLSNHLP